MSGQEEEVDLFENYDELPEDVQMLLDKYAEMDNTYEECASLVAELNLIGYTCEYGLDGIPYGLKQL